MLKKNNEFKRFAVLETGCFGNRMIDICVYNGDTVVNIEIKTNGHSCSEPFVELKLKNLLSKLSSVELDRGDVFVQAEASLPVIKWLSKDVNILAFAKDVCKTFDQILLDDILESHREWLDSDGEYGEQADLSHCGLSELSFWGQTLECINFSGAILRRCDFTAATASGCDFTRADLRESDFTGFVAIGADFTNSRLEGAWFQCANMFGGTFNGARFQKANLFGSDLDCAAIDGTAFRGCNLTHVKLRNTKGTADFKNAILDRVLWE